MTAPSRTRVTIIGRASHQCTPKLLVDFVNTPVARDADVVLHDIDAAPRRMVELAAVDRVAGAQRRRRGQRRP